MRITSSAMTGNASDDLERRLGAALPPGRTEREHPLAPYTTYGVGGPCRLMATVENQTELEALAGHTAGSNLPILVVGRGSNLLVADAGFDGLVVRCGRGLGCHSITGTKVRAAGAVLLPVLARASVAAGLGGFEWAVGVPGAIGGAVRMNAGGHSAELVDVLVSATIVDLETGVARTRSAEDLALGYRTSRVRGHQVVAGVILELSRRDPATGQAELAEIVRWRRANQPGGRNAGSVFTNPPGRSAGELIESAGAKGLRIGSAEVSAKHANFIQVDEGGSAGDIVAVMREIRRRVTEVHGIELVAETHLVGFDSEMLAESFGADRTGKHG